jgi:hypothetical protein
VRNEKERNIKRKEADRKRDIDTKIESEKDYKDKVKDIKRERDEKTSLKKRLIKNNMDRKTIE